MENKKICYSNPVNQQKRGEITIKTKKLFGYNFTKHYLCFLRYQGGIAILRYVPYFSTKTEKGGFSKEISVTTNKY